MEPLDRPQVVLAVVVAVAVLAVAPAPAVAVAVVPAVAVAVVLAVNRVLAAAQVVPEPASVPSWREDD